LFPCLSFYKVIYINWTIVIKHATHNLRSFSIHFLVMSYIIKNST
jgi:hypothetical protein